MDIHPRIQRLKDITADRPDQGTKDWKDARMKTINASELYNAVIDRGYVHASYIINKQRRTSCKTNMYMCFGTFMESAIRNHTEIVFGSKIYEFPSVPSSNFPCAGSPDGIVMINASKLREMHIYQCEIISRNSASSNGLSISDGILYESIEQKPNLNIILNEDREYLALLEYKCPSSRMPEYGNVPHEYIPQVLLNIELCDADVGIYIDSYIRACAIEDLETEYYQDMNNPGHKIREPMTPIRTGIMFYYYHNGKIRQENEHITEMVHWSSTQIYKFIESIRNSHYTEKIYTGFAYDLEEALELCNTHGQYLITVVAYKIYRVYYNVLYRQNNLMDIIGPHIIEVHDIIKSSQDISCDEVHDNPNPYDDPYDDSYDIPNNISYGDLEY
jgi:hypothetical protein